MEDQFEQRIITLNNTPPPVPLPASTEKKTYTVPEIQDILGISSSTAYLLIKKNLFRVVKFGRTVRISKRSFDAWLDGQIEGVS